MCAFSSSTKNRRDAREGETLVVTPTHGTNWLTSPGQRYIAVCTPDKCRLQLCGLTAAEQSRYGVGTPGPVVILKQGGNFHEPADQIDFQNSVMIPLNELRGGLEVKVLPFRIESSLSQPTVQREAIPVYVRR